MKVYLVGGAVRDRLLGYPSRERDWVVVGGTPNALISKGYQQVGREFPVFLHPLTHEEYALARTERKTRPGYHGFACDFNPKVTLEEDLSRRDLTINAMAEDCHGVLIDPYHGQADLKAKLLRHVSDAFVEDPVRVLRVARFAARFHHLGFQVAKETLLLMQQMCREGELAHLVPERVWQEWVKSLSEKTPEAFIQTLRQCGALQVVLPEIDAMFGVPNAKEVIPEIDTGIHALNMLQKASVVTESPVIRFAVFTKEIGKIKTPVTLWPLHPEPDLLGQQVMDELCQRLRIPNEFGKTARSFMRFHARIRALYALKAEAVVECLEQLDAFRKPQLFEKIMAAHEASLGSSKLICDWRMLLNVCSEISAKTWVEQGHRGEAIRLAIHEARVKQVRKFLNEK